MRISTLSRGERVPKAGEGSFSCGGAAHRTDFFRHRSEAGVSLLEILIAITILGLSFAAIFSSLSAALRTTDTLGRYNRLVQFGERKLAELELDPTLEPGEDRSGVSDSGIRWRATTALAAERPSSNPERPVQLMRILLEARWTTRAGKRSVVLQTLKLRVPEAPGAP